LDPPDKNFAHEVVVFYIFYKRNLHHPQTTDEDFMIKNVASFSSFSFGPGPVHEKNKVRNCGPGHEKEKKKISF